jgi:hypothetical protein
MHDKEKMKKIHQLQVLLREVGGVTDKGRGGG